jgi:hypothetical protein
MQKKYSKLIIVGAPRSGTNMLRDLLCHFEGVGTWPCDEINYIWRHGNLTAKTDEFSSAQATPAIKKYIRNKFDKLARKNSFDFVVEKTCANSLRVSFVEEIFPDAKYIFIVRDGVDVSGSANLRWKANLNFLYILKKARFVPIFDFPYYFFHFFTGRLHKVFSRTNSLSVWGPKFSGLSNALKFFTLEEVCAIQWKKCVESSEKALSQIPNDRVIRVKYEEFVTSPEKELSRILDECSIPYNSDDVNQVTESVSSESIGKGRRSLKSDKVNGIIKIISKTLMLFNYDK